MSTIINNNAITKMYKGDTPIYSFSINSGGDINLTNIDITTNGTYTAPDGEGYKTINVDVPTGGDTGKIDVAATGIKLSHSTFSEIPDIYDFSNVTDMGYMFANCENITTISPIDTSNVTNMSYMFYDCDSLTTIPLLNTSNVTDMSYMFTNCENLTTIPLLDCGNVTNMSHMFRGCSFLFTIPQFDTGNVTDMSYMFYNCNELKKVPLLDTSKVTNMDSMFYNCSKLITIPQFDTSKVESMKAMFSACYSLQSIPLLDCGKVTKMSAIFGFSKINTLTDLGGVKDLKISVTSDFLDRTPNLTVDSLMNVINNIYDLTANGLSGKKLCFGQTNLDKLTAEQIAVATAKGWTLTA